VIAADDAATRSPNDCTKDVAAPMSRVIRAEQDPVPVSDPILVCPRNTSQMVREWIHHHEVAQRVGSGIRILVAKFCPGAPNCRQFLSGDEITSSIAVLLRYRDRRPQVRRSCPARLGRRW
jgi:hypothetical protein